MFEIDSSKEKENRKEITVSGYCLWRYIKPSQLRNVDGALCVLPSAFDIKRCPETKKIKEPSASLYRIDNNDNLSQEASQIYLDEMNNSIGYSVAPNSAGGGLIEMDFNELNKDPLFKRLFKVSKTKNWIKKTPTCLLTHWDIKYLSDDLSSDVQTLKNMLGNICHPFKNRTLTDGK